MSNIHEEEALGKAYDSRLMKRLLQYMRPIPVAGGVCAGAGGDRDAAGTGAADFFSSGRLTIILSRDLRADSECGRVARRPADQRLVYLGVLIFDFLAQYVQIRIMQRVGQQTMYDMRTEIFGRLQRLPMSYFDRNPVGPPDDPGNDGR